MKYIVLTGGIGSGKSTVARIFQCMGFPIYYSDKEASRLMNTDPIIRQELEEQFGKQVYCSNGKLNKPAVAQIIFNDPQSLQTINSIVHPHVIEDFVQWGKSQKMEYLFFESAILFEAHLDHFFNKIICVTAPEEVRLNRVIKRDGLKAEQIKARMRNQMDEHQKCQHADFIIHNTPHCHLIEQILDTLKIIKQP